MIHKVKTAYLKFALPFAVSTVISISSFAQLPEDALRLSWLPQSGTARNQALGGVMGSLGGDITATFVNPAGLGFYRTNEFVISPGFNILNNKSDFRGTNTKEGKSSFNLGTSGIVLGFPGQRGKSSAMSIAVNRTANFNNSFTYRGSNDFSSYSEQFAEEAANSGIDIGAPLDQANISLGAKMAIYTYLIDTATINGNTQIVGLPEFLASRNQEMNTVTTGGITEIALGLASNSNDRFYIGATLGLPIVNYSKRTSFTESDPTSNPNNDFDYSNFDESTTTRGVGVNLKAGLIFKPVEALRLGLAAHTPTLYGLRDSYTSTMTTATESYNGVSTVSSNIFTGNAPAQYDYDLVTPWKVLASAAYVFGENEDVTKQKGFLSADVEYISYKGNSFKSAVNSNDVGYYNSINSTIDQIYRSNFNVKVGGELKFETIMARAGFAHYGNPYADTELKAGRNFASAGVGYRDKGMFLDLTYVYAMQKDVNFPYRLGDRANTFAETKTNGSKIVLTAGIKF